MRQLLNLVYAIRVERAVLASAVASHLTYGQGDPLDVDEFRSQGKLDEWLEAPSAEESGDHSALLSYLTN